jgi:D-arabinose 1-dehydrogenase-like Zn-dependent alcohol dehydrogenase
MPKMKAVQASKAGAAFEVVERDVPEPGPGQVRIEVEACGVCHSDAFVRGGGFPGLTLPRIPGHEIAERVDKIAPNVTEWKVGERVGVGWHGGHCFVCNACRKGLFLNCEKAQITGISYDGGYAEYVAVPRSPRAPVRLEDGRLGGGDGVQRAHRRSSAGRGVQARTGRAGARQRHGESRAVPGRADAVGEGP